MADQQDDTSPSHVSNAQERAKLIIAARNKQREFDSQIAAARVDLKALNKERKDFRNQVVKGQLGEDLGHWDASLVFVDAEDDTRRRSLTLLLECCNALSVPWPLATPAPGAVAAEQPAVPLLNGAAKDGEDFPDSAEVATRNQGRMAGLDGKGQDANPWPTGTKANTTWEGGRMAGQKELVERLGRPKDSEVAAARGVGAAAAPPKRPRGRPPREPGAPPSPYKRRARSAPLLGA